LEWLSKSIFPYRFTFPTKIRIDYRTLPDIDDLECLFDEEQASHEDRFASSLDTNVPNAIDIDEGNPSTTSPGPFTEALFDSGRMAVDSILPHFLRPDVTTASYNFIEELEDGTIKPSSVETPIKLSKPLHTITISDQTRKLAPAPQQVFSMTTSVDIDASMVKKKRYFNVFTIGAETIRTRRKEKPRTRRPNPFGRIGCKRCLLCRTHRQKVICYSGNHFNEVSACM
jgi:hypothetical protein